jgi:hypothetical protein
MARCGWRPHPGPWSGLRGPSRGRGRRGWLTLYGIALGPLTPTLSHKGRGGSGRGGRRGHRGRLTLHGIAFGRFASVIDGRAGRGAQAAAPPCHVAWVLSAAPSGLGGREAGPRFMGLIREFSIRPLCARVRWSPGADRPRLMAAPDDRHRPAGRADRCARASRRSAWRCVWPDPAFGAWGWVLGGPVAIPGGISGGSGCCRP